MTTDAIAKLRGLLAASTPGPWTAKQCEYEKNRCDGIDDASGYEVVTTDSGVYEPDWQTAQLFCAAVNALPSLLDEHERAMATLRDIADASPTDSEGMKRAQDAARAAVMETANEACEVCDGTGTVYAWMTGRNHAHPCPRGCTATKESE